MRFAARLDHDAAPHALTLTVELFNDERAPVACCARGMPVANLYGFWGIDVEVRWSGGRASLHTLLNPAWGVPAPPLLPPSVTEQALVTIAPGAAMTIALPGCLVPRALLPSALDGEWLLSLGVPTTELLRIFGEGALPYGHPIALLARAPQYELLVSFSQRRQFGFAPPRELELVAPPIALTLR